MILNKIFHSPHKPMKKMFNARKKIDFIVLRCCEKMLSEFQVNDSLHNEGTNTVVMGESG